MENKLKHTFLSGPFKLYFVSCCILFLFWLHYHTILDFQGMPLQLFHFLGSPLSYHANLVFEVWKKLNNILNENSYKYYTDVQDDRTDVFSTSLNNSFNRHPLINYIYIHTLVLYL